jgi:hypothetical protein
VKLIVYPWTQSLLEKPSAQAQPSLSRRLPKDTENRLFGLETKALTAPDSTSNKYLRCSGQAQNLETLMTATFLRFVVTEGCVLGLLAVAESP